MGLDGGVRVDHDGVRDGTVPVPHRLYKAEGFRQVDEAVHRHVYLVALHDSPSMMQYSVPLESVILVQFFRRVLLDLKSGEVEVIMFAKSQVKICQPKPPEFDRHVARWRRWGVNRFPTGAL